MSLLHEDAVALLPALVCGLLDAEEAVPVQGHLDACPRCLRESESFGAALGELGEELEPPPEVWEALEEALAVEVLQEAVDLDSFEAEAGDMDPLQPVATTEADGGLRRLFGPYEVLDDVSQSPRAVLYLARREGIPESLALKVLREGPLLPRRWVERFLHDAQALVKIDHPHLAEVREVGRHQSFPFFARAWIPGESLGDWLERDQPPTLEQVLTAAAEAAEGLHAAHAHGVVHRGLRPENVIVGEDGCARVVDFALEPGGDLRVQLASSEHLAGDPRYQAPEQVRGEGVDRRTDVYALGAVLYHLLAGVPPCEGESGEELLQCILDEPIPRLRSRARNVPAAVEQVVSACLARDPSKRYASARRLAEDLHRCLRGEPLAGPVRPRQARGFRASRRALALVTGLALTGGLAALRLTGGEQTAAGDAAWDVYAERVDSGLVFASGQLEQGAQLAEDRRDRSAARVLEICLDQIEQVRRIKAWGPRAADGPAFLAARNDTLRKLEREACWHLGLLALSTSAAEPSSEQLERAVVWWERAWALYEPGSRQQLALRLSRALADLGRLEEGLAKLDAIPDPTSKVAWQRAQLLLEDRPAAVGAELDRVIELGGEGLKQALLLRAERRVAGLRYHGALSDLDRHLELRRHSAPALVARARVHLALGNLERASDDLQAVRQQPHLEHDTLLGLEGMLALLRSQPRRAQRTFERLSETQGDRFQQHAQLGFACEANLDYEGAQRAYRAAQGSAWGGWAPGLGVPSFVALGWLELFQADPILCQLEAERILTLTPGLATDPSLRSTHPLIEGVGARLRQERLARAAAGFRAFVWAGGDPAEGELARLQGEPERARDLLDRSCEELQHARTRLLQRLRVDPPSSADPRTGAPRRGERESPLVVQLVNTRLIQSLAMRARVSVAAGQLEHARDRLDVALSLDPRSIVVHCGLAELARREGDVRTAKRELDQVSLLLEAGVGTLGQMFQEGQRLAARVRRGDPDYLIPALRAFLRVDMLAPQQPDAALAAARLLAESGRSRLALSLLDRAQTTAPELPGPYLQRGFVLLGQLPDASYLASCGPAFLRDPAAAREAFTQVLSRSGETVDLADARYGLALAALQAGDDRVVAGRELELALHSLPADPHLASAEVLVRQRRVLDCKTGLSQDTETDRHLQEVNAALEQRARLELGRAKLASSRYDHDEALASLDRALSLAPGLSELWEARGAKRVLLGDLLGGAQDMCRATQLDPKWVRRFDSQRWSNGYMLELDPIVAAAERSRDACPHVASLHFLVGMYRLARLDQGQAAEGDPAAGVGDMSRALALAPGFHAARLLRAELYDWAGDPAAALADLEAVRLVAPQLVELQFRLAGHWARRAAETQGDEAQASRSRAIEALTRAGSDGLAGYLEALRRDPVFDSLREDPAFEALLQAR